MRCGDMIKRSVAAISEAWRTSRSKQIIFQYEREVFWLRDDALAQVGRLGLLHTNAGALGFFNDGWLTELIRRLIQKGYTVAVAEGQTLRTVSLGARASKRVNVESRAIGLAPELLVDACELESWATRLTDGAHADQAIRQLGEQLHYDEGNPTPSYGPIYVYQLSEDIYEVDWELTGMPEHLFQMLMVAARQSNRMLRCRLVLARGHRQTKGGVPTRLRLLTVSDSVTYGQLRLF